MKVDDKMSWADQDWREEIKRLTEENEKLRAELATYTGPNVQVDHFPTHTRIRIFHDQGGEL